jgi:murein DD-endopeptidase MepM/ murein hydrolase activator NlpD
MGNFVIIRGRHDRFRYLYAHLREASPMRKGDRVRTNQLVGRVGLTGNASGTPCHLHIELRDDGPVDPEPYLRRWEADGG